jgi:hypothetical protein
VYDWIIEADVYRLRKAASEAGNSNERRGLEALAERKLTALSLHRRNAEAGLSSNA